MDQYTLFLLDQVMLRNACYAIEFYHFKQRSTVPYLFCSRPILIEVHWLNNHINIKKTLCKPTWHFVLQIFVKLKKLVMCGVLLKTTFSSSLGFKICNVSLKERSKVNLVLPPLIKPSTFLVGLHFYMVFFSYFKFSYKSKNLYSVAYSYFLNPLFSFSFVLKMRNVSLKEKDAKN